MTDTELLTKVEAALSGTLDRNAQQIQIAGRSITSFSLKELIDLRKDLEMRIARANSSGRSSVVQFRNPTS